VLQRFERRLGGMVEGLFARAFKSEVQPVEVAAALQRELDDRAAVVGRDRTLVPNHFVVELGDHDFDRLDPYATPLTHELAAMVREHGDDQRYSFVGPVEVELLHTPGLETGVFHIRSDVVPGAEHPGQADAAPPNRADIARDAAPLPDLPPMPPRTPAPQPTASDPSMTTAVPVVPATPLPTSAPPRTYGRLVVREGKHAGYELELRHAVTTIGRGMDADVRLTDQAVSRRHAELRVVADGVMLNDLQSTNGTRLNGVRITSTPISDGDEIRVGETALTYLADEDPRARG